MMHDREKSHSAIVAAKPTNKADATSVANAAEPVEPRAGTKRNAGKQNTHRTQCRVRVTQALDRVRQAAFRRQTLEVRTGCPNWARPGLCGGGEQSPFLPRSTSARAGEQIATSRLA